MVDLNRFYSQMLPTLGLRQFNLSKGIMTSGNLSGHEHEKRVST